MSNKESAHTAISLNTDAKAITNGSHPANHDIILVSTTEPQPEPANPSTEGYATMTYVDANGQVQIRNVSQRDITVVFNEDSKTKLSLAQQVVGDHDFELELGDGNQIPFFIDMKSKVIFTLVGCSHMFYWNSLLNVLNEVRVQFFPNYSWISETLTATCSIFNLIGMLIVYGLGGGTLLVSVCCAVMLSCVCLSTVISIVIASDRILGVSLLHICVALAGWLVGIYQSQTVSLASTIGDGSLNTYVSSGQGICGIISFAIYVVMTQFASPEAALWVLMIVGTLVALFGGLSYRAYSFRVDVRDVLIANRTSQQITAVNHDHFLSIFRESWKCHVGLFVTLFLTLFMFPSLSPLGWRRDYGATAIIGVFQIFDFIGRYGQAFVSVNSPAVLLNLASGRLVILALVLATFYAKDNVFMSHYMWQSVVVALLALTNGWLASSFFCAIPQSVKPDNRQRAGVMAVGFVLSGISVGLWSARLFMVVAN